MALNLVNFVMFQAGWFASVLGAANGLPWLGPVVIAALLATHAFLHRCRTGEIVFWLGALATGYFADSLLVLAGVLAFPPETILGAPSPVWMVALWGNFAMTMNASLGWLRDRLVVAAVFGAIGGPLAYWGGMRLGAIVIAPASGVGSLTAFSAIALEWAVATPLLIVAARTARGAVVATPAVREASA